MSELAQDGGKKKKDKEKLVDVEAADAAETQEAQGQDTRAGAQAGVKKLRLTLVDDEQSQLSQFQQTLKDRGVKNFEIGDIIAEALATIPKTWWDAKVEEMTPLEWKLHTALENPEMREKLMSLLNGAKK